MKQLKLTDLTSALSDEPKTIAERLEIMGIGPDQTAGKIPDDLLSLTVYGSSFLKFLQDNAQKLEQQDLIDANALPPDFKNPFESDGLSIRDRLKALDIAQEDIDTMFSAEALNVVVGGDEFQDFILQHQDKFLDKLGQLAGVGGES